MGNTPYEILGVSADASYEELKRAYRELSRNYHPDTNINSSNIRISTDKFIEVQEAYEMLVSTNSYPKINHSKASNYNSVYSNDEYRTETFDFSKYTSDSNEKESQAKSEEKKTEQKYANNYSSDVQMKSVYNLMGARRYKEALGLLSGIHNRDAKWYYASAFCNTCLSQTEVAKTHAEKAVILEPGNPQYTQLNQQLNGNAKKTGKESLWDKVCFWKKES